jgi:phosphoribosylcarboxyaminoimidazole (NCAIR) mutase
MPFPPDVPVAIVVIHLAALAALLTHTVVSNHQRLLLLRQNRADVQDAPEAREEGLGARASVSPRYSSS